MLTPSPPRAWTGCPGVQVTVCQHACGRCCSCWSGLMTLLCWKAAKDNAAATSTSCNLQIIIRQGKDGEREDRNNYKCRCRKKKQNTETENLSPLKYSKGFTWKHSLITSHTYTGYQILEPWPGSSFRASPILGSERPALDFMKTLYLLTRGV